MVMEIDLMPFICEALASNQSVHKRIEDIYEENRVEYYQLAKSSPWYSHEVVTSQSIFKEIVMKRALGILSKGETDKILEIIKKGWRQIYNIVKQQDIVKISEVMLRLLPIEKKQQLDKLTNDEFNSYVIIPILLGTVLEKKLDTDDEMYVVALNVCAMRLMWADGKYKFSFKTLEPEDKKKVQNFKESVYAEAKVNRHWISHTTTALDDMHIYTTGLCYLFDTEGLSTSIIEDEILSERDINEILAAYFVTADNRNRIEGSKFLAAGHIVKALLRSYKRLKEEHFKTNKETLYLELETTQHEAKEARLENKRLQWIVEDKNKEIENLRKQVSSEYGRVTTKYREKVKKVQKENSEMKQKLEQLSIDLKEYEKIIFTQQEDVVQDFPDIDLSSVRGVVVGGHKNWHSKIRTVLPDNWRFIHPDDSYDLNVIANTDVIFFYVDYLNHMVFSNIIAEARRRNIPVGYLKQTSEQECLREIKRILSQNLT